MAHYMALTNIPGYLSENDDPPVFDTAREAWQYLVSEVDRSWDEYPSDSNGACIDAHSQLSLVDQSKPGSITAPTPGYEGTHDLGIAYCVVETDQCCGMAGTPECDCGENTGD